MQAHQLLCRTCKTALIFLAIIIIVIGVPCILNWLLQTETPLKSIIGGENAPVEWLSFWGSYLAAIGAGTAAIIALYNNRKGRKISYYSNRVRDLDERYRETEEKVREFETIHTLSKLHELSNQLEENPSKARLLCFYYLEKDLKFVSFFAQKQRGDQLDTLYAPYFSALAAVNIYYSEIIQRVIDIMSELTDENKEAIVLKLKAFLASLDQDAHLNQLTHTMYDEGWNLLEKLRDKRTSYYQKLQIESDKCVCKKG